MPIIQATTPTNAGAAQVFDTSGVAQIAAQERDRKNKRLQELMTEYDTRGIWARDTDYIQGKIEEVNNFAMNHAKELANPSNNMKTWQEFQKLQSGVKNSVVYSIAAKEKFDKGNQKYNNSQHNMYMTDQNRDLLFAYSEKPTTEQYADGSAWADVEKGFNANLDIQPQKYVDLGGTFMNEKAPQATGAVEGGRNVVETGYEMDMEGLTAGLKPIFTADTHEGASLRKQYGNDVDAFAQDVAAMTNKPSEYNLVSPRAERADGGKRTATDRKRDAAVAFSPGSRQGTYESVFSKSTDRKTKGDLTPALDVKSGDPLLEAYGMTTNGDKVMVFRPIKIQKNITEGYDTTTGEMIETGAGKKYKNQYPVERGTYIVSNGDLELSYKKDGKQVVSQYKAGEPLPDLEQLLKNGDITQNEFDRAIPYMKEQEGYMVYATNEDIDVFELAASENPMNMLKAAGTRLLMVSLESLDFEVDQALMEMYDTDQQWYIDQERQNNPRQAEAEENYLDY